MSRTGFAAIDTAEMYYEIHGAGEPLLMIAGMASDSQSWFSIKDALVKKFELIIFDNRHAGRTRSKPDASAVGSVAEYADDCAKLLTELGYKKVHVLGHSLGGMIAGALAARHPARVNRLVIASAAPRGNRRNQSLFNHWCHLHATQGPDKDFYQEILRWLVTPNTFENDAFMDGAIAYAMDYPHAQSREDFLSQAKVVMDFDGEAFFRAITAPTLVIGGERDIMFPKEDLTTLAEMIPGATQKMLPDCGHSIVIEGAELFSSAAADFFNEK